MSEQMTVPPKSREIRAEFWRGFETAVEACILIVKGRTHRTGLEEAMRNLYRRNVPRAGDAP
jgi:hypothetical protein